MKVEFRTASAADRDAVHDLSRRVQDKLTQSGSLQEIGPIPLDVLDVAIARQTLFVFEADSHLIGSVLIAPLTVAQASGWNLPQSDLHFLSKFMIEPSQQGRGLGQTAMRLIQQHFQLRGGIVLDCWAGNVKLRQFYEALDFHLHGIFDENDYQISVYFWTPSAQR